jgi:hypothetical protein
VIAHTTAKAPTLLFQANNITRIIMVSTSIIFKIGIVEWSCSSSVSTTAIREVQTVQEPHMGVREENSGSYLSVARELASQQILIMHV